MNIEEVKSSLGYSTLNLNTAKDSADQPTEWLRHWDNHNRIAISIHKETVAKIKANPALELGLQTETREGELGSYVSHRIVAYNPAEVTL